LARLGRVVRTGRLVITKRHKFILTALFSSVAFLLTQIVVPELRTALVLALIFVTGSFSLVSLWQDFAGVKYFILLILPIFFAVSISLFGFLLPDNFWMKGGLVLLFGFGMYCLLLTQNIYNVAAIRTIALIRAAHAVGFIFTLLTAFFAFTVLFSFHLAFYIQSVIAFFIAFVITLVTVWTFILEDFMPKRGLAFALAIALGVFELAWVFAFLPTSPVLASLAVTAALYVILGLTQFYIAGRLMQKTVFEYSFVGVFVLLLILLATSWRGVNN